MRRSFLLSLAFTAAAAACAPAALAQDPAAQLGSGPFTLVAPFPPGGPVDTLARMLADGLGAQYRQAAIVENKPGSGGAGRWTGGNGGVRRVRFLEAMTASILSNGRKHGAFGMAGGEPGQVGINRVVRGDGRVEALEHIGQAQMQPGDVFEVYTPGGGGFGAKA